MNTRALTSAALAGLLRPMLQDVNVVSAPIVAKDRGIVVEETRREAEGDYESLITVTVTTDRQSRHVAGTVFADGRPRIVDIKGIRMDAEFGAVDALHHQSGQAGLHRQVLLDARATPASTSRPSISAARRPAATPSRWSRSTANCRPTCSPRCARCRKCSRPSRCGFERSRMAKARSVVRPLASSVRQPLYFWSPP